MVRGQKRGPSTAWRVWVPGAAKQARRTLCDHAPLKRGCAVQVRASCNNSVLIVFGTSRGYDAVHGRVSRATGGRIEFNLTREEDDGPPPGGGDDAAPPGDNAGQGRAGDNAGQQPEAEAAPPGDNAGQQPEAEAAPPRLRRRLRGKKAEGTAVSRPSAGFLTLKLVHLASGEETQGGGVDLSTLERLGRGGYGSVYKGDSHVWGQVAWKALRPKHAARELAAHAALPPHDSIAPIFDIGWSQCGLALLALPMYDSSLSTWARARGAALQDEEVRHVTVVVLGALAHMHRSGVLHSDVKPANILVKGPGLFPGECTFTDSGSCATFAEMLRELPSRLQVVLADLGSAHPAHSARRVPGQRTASRPEVGEENVQVTTLWYRAPEVCLGDWEYGAGVDMWSCGCVLGELASGNPLFKASSEYGVLVAIFRLLGTPGADSELARLPLYKKTFPTFAADLWPGRLRDHGDPDFLELLRQLLLLGPSLRWSAETALASPYCRMPPLEVQFSAARAARGLPSVAQGQLDPRTLQWLQADPCWHGAAGFVGTKQKHECHTEKERGVKYEEGGFTGNGPPSTVWCIRTDCSKPSRAGRVAAFTRAFTNANKAWLDELTAAIRAKLACFPQEALGENGRHFVDNSLATNAWAYATIQVMKPSEREDPPHFDGGASLLHAGLTIWGKRGMDVQLQPEAEWRRLHQKPGSFYVGNLCAAWHKVSHFPPEDAKPLWVEDGFEGVRVAVMLRTNVFSAARARTMNGQPSPAEVYQVVNTAVAQHLATKGLHLPTFSACVAAAAAGHTDNA